jgi:hypothetical protein
MSNKTQFKPGTFILVPNKHKLQDLSMKAIVVWVTLCAYADNDGVCFPSKTTLSKLCGLGERTLSRGLEELKEKKWISWETRKKGDGSFLSNYYKLYLM